MVTSSQPLEQGKLSLTWERTQEGHQKHYKTLSLTLDATNSLKVTTQDGSMGKDACCQAHNLSSVPGTHAV